MEILQSAFRQPFSRRSRALLGRLTAPALLPLALRRVATKTELQHFAEGFASQHGLKPSLVWGLLAVPECRAALHRLGEMAGHFAHAAQKGGAYTQFSKLDGNFLNVWTARKLTFLHFEKCAGSALLSWLAQQFHPRQINADPYRDLPAHLFSRLPSPGLYQDAALVWGHYDMPTLQRLAPDRAVVALLREPRARLVSLYHFWRSVDPGKFDPELSFAVGAAHRLSLEAFLNQDDPYLVDMIDNLYARRLTGLYASGADTDPLHDAPQTALRLATDALKNLFYVGITEQLDRSAAAMAARLGILPPAQPLRSNVTAEIHQDPGGWYRQVARTEISAGAQAALDRRTTLDRTLYAIARQETSR